LSTVSVAACFVAVPLSIEPATGLTDREIGRLPLRRLAFGPRQRRTNQWPVHGPFVVSGRSNRLLGVGRDSFGLFCRFL
jgi:hypothetical protein